MVKFLWGLAFFIASEIARPEIGWWGFPLAIIGWLLWITLAAQLISQDHGN